MVRSRRRDVVFCREGCLHLSQFAAETQAECLKRSIRERKMSTKADQSRRRRLLLPAEKEMNPEEAPTSKRDFPMFIVAIGTFAFALYYLIGNVLALDSPFWDTFRWWPATGDLLPGMVGGLFSFVAAGYVGWQVLADLRQSEHGWPLRWATHTISIVVYISVVTFAAFFVYEARTLGSGRDAPIRIVLSTLFFCIPISMGLRAISSLVVVFQKHPIRSRLYVSAALLDSAFILFLSTFMYIGSKF